MKAVPKLDENESGLMVLKRQNLLILMHIYHKQCGIIQQNSIKRLNKFHIFTMKSGIKEEIKDKGSSPAFIQSLNLLNHSANFSSSDDGLSGKKSNPKTISKESTLRTSPTTTPRSLRDVLPSWLLPLEQ